MTVDGSSITADEYAQLMAGQMSEKTLQTNVIRLATATGWRVYHTHDSRRSQPGFPDLVLIHPQRGLTLWRELKTQKGKATHEQLVWLRDLITAGNNASIWRPLDWHTKAIHRELGATS